MVLLLTDAWGINMTEQELINESNRLADIGQGARGSCHQCLNIIAGYNKDKNLSLFQLTQMMANFSQIYFYLEKGFPATAKKNILAVEPDGVIITQELKEMLMYALREY